MLLSLEKRWPRYITTYNEWFLCFNKRWLSERFSLLGRYWGDMNCFYLSIFYSVLTFKYFYTITNFYSHSHHYCYEYFCYYCFCHCNYHYYFFIFNAFKFIFLVFTILFYLCIYRIFLNLKQMMRPKHYSKLAIKILRLYQCLW